MAKRKKSSAGKVRGAMKGGKRGGHTSGQHKPKRGQSIGTPHCGPGMSGTHC